MILAALIAVCLRGISLGAQTMELRLLERDRATTRLFVTNAAPGNVNLEGSFDLENWFHIASATANQGVAAFAHSNDEPIDTWFYRAVVAPAPVVIHVGAKLDTNQFSGGLILPETGGQIQLTDASGVFYQLTVGSNLVSEPTAIRMTVITNFSDMPLTNRFRAAVAFEPDGLEFRGAAELKIRFPEPIPTLEMVGYGFQGDGADFHLCPWESSTNEVTIAVTHFSGIGVAAEPFTATGPDRYGKGLEYTRDAIREADNWAGNQYREILRNQSEGKITAEESAQQKRLVKRQRDLRVYLNAIKPLLAMAQRDCEIGQVVLKRLDQLDGDSGESVFYDEMVRVGPAIRCVCARKYLELCERNAISGNIATEQMTRILDLVALKTGRIDDPNCDLGSDFDILRRLAKGKCHKPWEGTIRYTKVFSSLLALGEEGSGFFHMVTNSDKVTYVGQITELLEEDGDVLEDGAWQSWTMKLTGKFSGDRLDIERTTSVVPDWTVVDYTVTKGVTEMPAEGDLMIRFDNGLFSSVSVGVGLGTNRYDMPLQTTTGRTVDCRGRDCPPSVPAETKNDGTEPLSLGKSPGITTAGLTAEWQPNGSLKIVYKQNDREEMPAGLPGFNETIQTLTIQLWKGSAP